MGRASGLEEQLRLEPIERLEDVGEDWDRLALATGHPFATLEWNTAWWRRFGGGRALYSFACRDAEGAVRAILPLYVAMRRPLAVARFLGYADLRTPLCAPADRSIAAYALQRVTRSPHRCRLILAERLPGEQGWGEALGGRRLGVGHDPILRIRQRSWDDFLASRSRNFRQQMRRRERRLVEEHGMTFRLASDAERLQGDMDTLFHLHAERWGGRTTGVFEGERGVFHREFAAAALERGWLRLWFAEIDGEAVAAWYGWRFAGSEWYFQAGRDLRWESLSVGTVLLAHTIREACRDGMDAYRFLAGLESYKLRFAEEDLGTETRLLGSPLLTGCGAMALRLGGGLSASLYRRGAR